MVLIGELLGSQTIQLALTRRRRSLLLSHVLAAFLGVVIHEAWRHVGMGLVKNPRAFLLNCGQESMNPHRRELRALLARLGELVCSVCPPLYTRLAYAARCLQLLLVHGGASAELSKKVPAFNHSTPTAKLRAALECLPMDHRADDLVYVLDLDIKRLWNWVRFCLKTPQLSLPDASLITTTPVHPGGGPPRGLIQHWRQLRAEHKSITVFPELDTTEAARNWLTDVLYTRWLTNPASTATVKQCPTSPSSPWFAGDAPGVSWALPTLPPLHEGASTGVSGWARLEVCQQQPCAHRREFTCQRPAGSGAVLNCTELRKLWVSGLADLIKPGDGHLPKPPDQHVLSHESLIMTANICAYLQRIIEVETRLFALVGIGAEVVPFLRSHLVLLPTSGSAQEGDSADDPAKKSVAISLLDWISFFNSNAVEHKVTTVRGGGSSSSSVSTPRNRSGDTPPLSRKSAQSSTDLHPKSSGDLQKISRSRSVVESTGRPCPEGLHKRKRRVRQKPRLTAGAAGLLCVTKPENKHSPKPCGHRSTDSEHPRLTVVVPMEAIRKRKKKVVNSNKPTCAGIRQQNPKRQRLEKVVKATAVSGKTNTFPQQTH